MRRDKSLLLLQLLILALAVTLCVLVGRAMFRNQPKTGEEIYQMVKPGMHRTDVEQMIGKPDIGGEYEVYYGRPPDIKSWQSPVSPGSIRIEYSVDNIVLKVDYYKSEGSKDQ
jgi:hypothetical protein